ncbi:phosphonate ABC transporter, permease protein PhnE [Natrarchaeobius sp. A-rgal3]|uniref:phosphonate ABC transporter, permease protein PhnE n=1 Tax=Natrarchaeobius versutus TaxID=1679078 RepID=UPI00350F4692
MSQEDAQSKWRRPTVFPSHQIKYTIYLLAIGFVLWSVWEVRPGVHRVIWGLQDQLPFFIENSFPPDFSPDARDRIMRETIETIGMAIVATILGVIVSTPIALMGANNISPPRVRRLGRGIIAVSRGFHSLIVAIIVVAAVGVGVLAGIITLVIATIGWFGKLLADDIEDIDFGQVEAARATGASRSQAFIYGILPQITPRFTALSVYRWDVNLRSATIIGIVGAGGIGQSLVTAFDRYDFQFAWAIILTILALVLLGELLSLLVRRRIDRGPQRPSNLNALRRSGAWTRFSRVEKLKQYSLGVFLLLIFALSYRSLDMSYTYVWSAPTAMADLFGRMLPPETAPVFLTGLIGPTISTINIAIIGTVLGIVLSFPVAYLAAEPTTPNNSTYLFGKFLISAARSVNVIIWVLVLVAIFGPGPFAGFLAVGIRSVGFLGKLTAEAIEEVDFAEVEAAVALGASKFEVIVYGIVPQIKPAFIGIATYRWDTNIRASTIVGFVGGGGIGVELSSTIGTFQWAQAMTILLVIISLVLISEAVSSYARSLVMDSPS